MVGMVELSEDELKSVKGGKCNWDYGYFFCCPSNSDKMAEQIEKYLKKDEDKARKYIQFCYEVCGYRGK